MTPPYTRRPHRRTILLCLVLLSAAGCEDMQRRWKDAFEKKPPETPVDSIVKPVASKAVDGTIQSVAYVDGLRKILVRGYGVVVGLVGTGGSDCPDEVRRYLEKDILRRQTGPADPVAPRELLNSRDSAVVEVTAEVPAAALAGATFDVIVRALGSQTVSLEGGTLLECDLKLIAATVSRRAIIEGKAICSARGPLFVSPFRRDARAQSDSAAASEDARVGRVLGGGILREDRRLRLVLHMPAYHLAVQVRNRLNSRFGAQVPVADAVSPDTIQLTIPPEFRRRERAFLELVMHTCLNGNPGFLQRRAAELAEEILHPDALYEDVSLAWEAIGRTIIPTLRPLYAQPNLAASYYAARAGLRLGDPDAVDPLARCAAQKTHPFRELAVEELGRASDSRRAADALRERLADPDPRIRLKAYEGLVRHRHESLRVTRVGDHFVLDEVDCPGETVVHLTTSDEPRIAILGTDPRLRTPLTYHVPRLITLSADAGDPHVRAVRVNPRTKVASPQLEAPLKLADFIRFLGDKPVPQSDGAVRGLGLDYAACVAVLHRLSQDGALGANLVIQRPSVSEQLWKLKTRERPESEL